jgi:uncharacterized membrane protein
MVSDRTPGEQVPGGRGGARRWLTIAFFVSLVANLFLGGVIAGRVFHVGRWFGQPHYSEIMGPMAGRALQHLLEPLSSADRQIVIDSVSAHSDDLLQLTRAVRDQRHAIVALLRAENFDRKAVDDAFVELRRRTDALQTVMAATIGDAVAKLSPAARKQLQD